MIECTHCGHENPEGARFCNSCAVPLADRDAPNEVRKTVTVVFCDVVGSTELGERSDPEVLRGMMARFYAAIRAPVERHGGTVEKVIGDALVAVFGMPVVREDDALRAVRAALEMRDAVRAMNEVEARIGVNTGDVLARDATPGESLVVGEAVSTTARLEQAAPPGEVLVGEATWALVAHACHGERVAPIVAKGKREPLVAWRLLEVDPSARGHRRRLDLPMIGREAELDLLHWALRRAERAHRPHLVTVLGQPGIGKSRLAAEVGRLRAGLGVLIGQCRATTASSSLEPLLDVVRGAIPHGRDARDALVELMQGDRDAAAVAACLAPDGTPGAPDIAWAASRLLGTLAATQTVAIVLEDVHWAADLLLDVVEQLLGRTRRQTLLVVCTARPEFAERRPGWGAGANSVSFALERLDDLQTRRLLTHASPAMPAERTERVVAAAEGNPLFAEHLAALFQEHSATAGLPRSIQVLLTARVEALPESERQVVTVSAVVGRDFPVSAVEALVGRPVADELELLAQRELIEPTVPGRRRFGHALLQEAAYALIPKRRRSELHEELAAWADANGSGDALVGHHLARAVALRAELGLAGDETDRIAAEAGARLLAAGRRADAMGDPVRATRLLEQAVTMLPESGPGYAAAMVELAAAGWNVLAVEERRRLLDSGADLAARHGLRALELRARILRLGSIPESSPDAVTEAEVLAETNAGLRELESLDDARALATALCTRAEIECSLGRAADAVASARRAIGVAVAADEDAVWAAGILVWALCESPIPVSQADSLLAGLIDELGVRPTVRSELIQGQATMALLRGHADEAWSLLDTAQEIERDLGRGRAWRLSIHRAVLLLRAGEFEAARRVLPGIVSEMERIDAHSSAAVVWSWLALAEARLGNHADAGAAAAAALSGVAFGSEYEAGARAHMVLCEVRLANGDADGAAAAGREAVAIAAAGDWVVLQADARLALARALGAAGDAEAAAVEARAAVRLNAAKGYVAAASEAEALLDALVLTPD